jgi:hypothetical protein
LWHITHWLREIPSQDTSSFAPPIAISQYHLWTTLKVPQGDLAPEEIIPTPWIGHAQETGMSLEHFYKVAIDPHLAKVGIPLLYTSVFWEGQSQVKPSEISPVIYRKWHQQHRTK